MRRSQLVVAGLGLLMVLVLVALLWMRWNRGAESARDPGDGVVTAAALSPSSTARSVRSRGSRPGPADPFPESTDVVEDETPVEVITVQVGDSSRRPRVLRYILFFQSHTFWPSAEEAPLPSGPVSDDLQALLDLEGSGEGNRESIAAARDTFLQSARDEGLLDPEPSLAADPWRALVALEAGHREANRQWLATLREARDAGNDELADGLEKDYASVLQLAQAVVEQHPDEPAADFARLYVMDAYAESLANTHDPEAGTRIILDILSSTDDSLVAETAASQLSNLSGTPAVDADQLDGLLDQLGSQYDPRARTALAQYGLDQAFALGDAERVDAWLNRFAEIVLGRCPDERGEEACEALHQELALTRGQAAAAWNAEASDWRSALVAAVWRCHLEEPFAGPDTTGEGRWEQAWTWDAWEPGETAFTDCLEEKTVTSPRPADGGTVRLRVKGGSRMILL